MCRSDCRVLGFALYICSASLAEGNKKLAGPQLKASPSLKGTSQSVCRKDWNLRMTDLDSLNTRNAS